MKSNSVAKINAIITFPTFVKIHFVCFTVTGSFLITIHLFRQFVRFSQGNSNCQTNEWQSEMTQLLWNIRNEFSDFGKVMMAFILATGFDFITYMSKMAFFGSFIHANGVFGIWFQWFLLFCMTYCITVKKPIDTSKKKKVEHSSIQSVLCGHRSFLTRPGKKIHIASGIRTRDLPLSRRTPYH